LLRRTYLDIIGVLPTSDEVRSFLNRDREGVKRSVLVEELLKRPEFADFWTQKLADLLLINSRTMGKDESRAYHAWLRGRIAENAAFHEIVRELVTSQGDVRQHPAANFYRVAADPRDFSEFVSRSFLGVRIQCARCHSHPFDRWTQADYYGFAAFFARTRFDGASVVTSERGEVEHPKTGKAVPPKVLGGGAKQSWMGDRRAALTEWMLSPDNMLLPTAIVNRVWHELMGRGIVEPIDDLRVTNPPSNPALLDYLSRDFVRHQYDLKYLIQSIVTSETYQQSSRTNEINRQDHRLFSHAMVRPLSAYVLADAIAQATGVSNQFPDAPEAMRAMQLADSSVPSFTLDVFGRCKRETTCQTSEAVGGGLTQALHLMNGDVINEKLRRGIVHELVSGGRSDREIVEELYLRTLSRYPDDRERTHWQALLRQSAAERRDVVEDLLWALLNSKEFAFNH
jgi:hypothetical protein